MKLLTTVLAVLLGVIILLALLLESEAEELSEISVPSASYCSLFARSEVLHDILHGPSLTADTDYILARATEHYAACLAVLPALMPVSDSLKDWLADIRDLLVLTGKERVADIGTEPAAASPTDEEWRQACRKQYVTWDEETGTVVRVGNPARVRCPCGGEVVCQ